MLSPTTTTTSSATTSQRSSTTTSESISDLISRSLHNFSTFFSRARPWPEFFSAAASLDLPPSLHTASSRFRLNSKYFSINYATVLSICIAGALIGSPISLVIISLLLFMWLIFYFFREGPVFLFGNEISDQSVLWSLILSSIVAIWYTGTINHLMVGVSVGVLVWVLHGVLKNPEGVFLDENDAVSDGLIAPKSGPSFSNGGVP